MKIAKGKNAKKNIFVGAFTQIIIYIIRFIVKSVLIYQLGAEYLGLNSLCNSILQVLNMAELGFGSAIVFFMYAPIADDDTERVNNLLGYYRKIYGMIGIFILVMGIILMPLLPYMTNNTCPKDVNVYVVWLLWLINTVISYWMFSYRGSLIEAHQRLDVTLNIYSLQQCAMGILQVLILYCTDNYYLFLLAMPVTMLIKNISFYFISRKMYPQYRCKENIDVGTKKDIKNRMSGIIVNKLNGVTRNSFDSIFISSFLGLQQAAIYGNYYYILGTVHSFSTLITNGLVAGIGNSSIRNSVDKNYEEFKKLDFWYMWIRGYCSVALLCVVQPFMYLWMGADMMYSLTVVILFSIYFYIMGMADIREMYINAMGLWNQQRQYVIIEAVSNIILNAVLGKVFGVYGIIFATIISMGIIHFGFKAKIIFQFYFGRDKNKEYFMLHMRYAFTTLLAGGVSILICNNLTSYNIGGLVLSVIISFMVSNSIYLLIYWHTREYQNAIIWILTIFHMEDRLKFLIPRRN